MSYLYLLSFEDDEGKFSKVGITNDLHRRLHQINTDRFLRIRGNGNLFSMIASWGLGTEELARKFEKDIHLQLSDCRFSHPWGFQGHSECFRIDPLECKAIIDSFYPSVK